MNKALLTSLTFSLFSSLMTHSVQANDELDDIIVTATRSETDVQDAPGSVTVINRQQIEQKGGGNLVDLIRDATGVSIRGVGTGGRKAITVRGLESRHTLILVDGKRIPSSNDSIGPNTDYQYDWIPADNIERIEVVRGPMSVLYGADALGGVINIITRKPGKKTAGSIKAQSLLAQGSAGGEGHDIEFNLSGSANDQLQLSLSGQQSRRSSLQSKLNPGQSATEGRKKQQLSLGLNWQPAEKQDIKLEVSQGQEDRWYDTQTRRQKPYQSQYDIERDHISLGWKGSIGKTSNRLRIYQSKIDIHNKATNGVKPTSPQQLKDTVMEGGIAFPVGQKQFITTGFERRIEKLKNQNLAKGSDEVTLNSLYLQDEIDLTDTLLFTLGARLDDHDVFGNETSPRASIVWNTTERLSLKASYGHGFRAPNIKQVSADYVFSIGTIKITGNPELQPETNNAYELGASYSADKFTLNGALFNNEVKNLIDLTGPITNRTYENIDKARLRGAEISSKINLRKGLDLNANYQYLDAKDGNGDRLKNRPRHTLSSGISWNKNNWIWSLDAQYLSGQIIEHNRVSTHVPGYAIWNAGVRKAINKHLDLAMRINNLSDVRLEEKSPAFLYEEYPRTLSLELSGKF